MTAIVDYGVGNLFSLSSSLRALGEEPTVTRDAEQLRAADRIILPGVGICLGMQLLFDKSLEYGTHEGLGLVPGEVVSLREDLTDQTMKVPHMGWNSLHILRKDPLLRYVDEGAYVYYVHSFYARNCAESTLAVSDYGGVAVTGVVRQGNVWGTQFHPEKSGETGLSILKAFTEL